MEKLGEIMCSGRLWRLPALIISFVFLILNYPALGGESAFMTTNSTPNSVVLTWTAPGDNGGRGKASLYDIRYLTNPLTIANWSGAICVYGELKPKSAGSAEWFRVTGLEPSTAYYFAIKTADEIPNWSAQSNIITKATAKDCEYFCGDFNRDCMVNLIDVALLIAFLYKGGSPPIVAELADVNSDGTINLLDILRITNFLYKNGPGLECVLLR